MVALTPTRTMDQQNKREWKRNDLKGKRVESEVVCFKGKIVESVEKFERKKPHVNIGTSATDRAASAATAAGPLGQRHSALSPRHANPVHRRQETPLGSQRRRDPRPGHQQPHLAGNLRQPPRSRRRLRRRRAHDAAAPEFRATDAMSDSPSSSQIGTLHSSSSSTPPPPPPPPPLDLTLSFPVSRPLLHPCRRRPTTPESGDVPLCHGVLHVVLPSPMEPPYLVPELRVVVCTRMPSSLFV
ncbi:hypothetical protein Fmac_025917 [Flemingia macrophylla]|uniref:Uncharacterized protein n=1 Tax=Flemingia macrophylla TaxID=520843 RepID=A0ABD1LDD9_9FABA